jgi:hypothetical protein
MKRAKYVDFEMYNISIKETYERVEILAMVGVGIAVTAFWYLEAFVTPYL